ncbi:MAG: hypothetical protein KKB90_06950 [Actinobacteria bacterium]|nr:hypothetical protein [Actinomycetota bacterium]MBU4218686.1 hypothetical protein [Actinomycetota bacterium]MBU4359293.1 hypothetical protein [Actinomycetota bacterium]MBU4392139.1 hypothetical protein [Actinomycetota bacterium]MBU4403747.1 hypothetical protein [Actinomycetota bacterium]
MTSLTSPNLEPETSPRAETVPANSRKTFDMLDHSCINGRAAIMVASKTAGKPIMVRCSMYRSDRGEGTDTVGGMLGITT